MPSVRSLRLLAGALLLSSVLVFRSSPAAPALAAGQAWTTYHYDNSRTANYTADGFFTAAGPGWTSPGLDGEIFAEPLVVGGLVYVATENNSIYALNAADGSVNWSKNLGLAALNPGFLCQAINPIGITSTPVIDLALNRLYAVGLVDTQTRIPRWQHHLWALDLASHAVLYETVVDAPGSDSRLENQRGALTLSPAGDRLYVPYGSRPGDRAGDCGNFQGFVTSVVSGDGTGLRTFQTTRAAWGGGAWAASGPSVDAAGNLFIATGNGYSGSTYDRAESVIKLSPLLADPPLDIWAPTNWQELDASDLDIGSIGPMLLGGTGLLFQSGKNSVGYILRQAGLGGGPSNPAFSAPLGMGPCFGGAAFDGTRIFVPCSGGLEALTLNAAGPSFAPAWTAGAAGCQADAPILAGGAVWWIDRCGTLRAADPVSGNIRYSSNVGRASNFSTPAAGGGKVFMAITDHLVSVNLTPAVGAYTPITPYRLLDTRQSVQLGPNSTRDVQVTGLGGVPASGVGAAAINLTVTNGSAPSYLSLFPTGQGVPLASSLNFRAGQTIANLAQVALGLGGMVTVYNSEGSADVVLDIFGWYAATPSTTSTAGLFRPLPPTRVLDTRSGTGGYSTPFGPNLTRDLDLRSALPDPRASAVVLNLTAVNGSAASYLTAYPAGTGSRPNASNLNFPAGRNLPVRAIVKLGSGASAGRVSLYNSEGYVDVVADLAGWFTDGTDAAATGGNYHPLPPSRILDTRASGQLGPGGTLLLPVAGQGGVPGGSSATAAVLNFAVTNPSLGSFLTVYPAGQALPLASDLNFGPAETIANLDLVKLGSGGAVAVYNNLGYTDVLADVAGYYS